MYCLSVITTVQDDQGRRWSLPEGEEDMPYS